MNRKILCHALALALAGTAAPAYAVTNVENNASIPFSFSNPGARSLGMGGAFLGLADDATAAYTNPAGLMGLGLEKQFSVEVRHASFDDPYVSAGSITYPPIDFNAVSFDTASESVTDLSFLSFVWPSERWSLAVYRHQLLDYENSFTSSGVAVSIPQQDFEGEVFARGSATDLEIVNYGVSFGWRLNDALSLGAGLSWYDFDIDTSTTRYVIGGAVGNAADVVNEQFQTGSDDAFGYNLGLLYRGSDNFQIGMAYRSAPEFDYRRLSVAGPANPTPGEVFLDARAGFEAPDMFGIGFAWRVSDTLTLTADVNKINYSRLTDPVESAFYDDETLQQFPALAEVLGRLRIDDVIEPHVGLEYVMIDMARPLSLRVGAWYEDSHTIRFEGDLREFETIAQGAVLGDAIANAALFSAGEDQVHYSVGLGWAFSSFQIDFAADFSDHRDTLSLSGVWRF